MSSTENEVVQPKISKTYQLYAQGRIYPFVNANPIGPLTASILSADATRLNLLEGVSPMRCYAVDNSLPETTYHFHTLSGRLERYQLMWWGQTPMIVFADERGPSFRVSALDMVDGRWLLADIYEALSREVGEEWILNTARDTLHWRFEKACKTPVRVFRMYRLTSAEEKQPTHYHRAFLEQEDLCGFVPHRPFSQQSFGYEYIKVSEG